MCHDTDAVAFETTWKYFHSNQCTVSRYFESIPPNLSIKISRLSSLQLPPVGQKNGIPEKYKWRTYL